MNPRLLHPTHPERICWGCDRLCPAEDLGCANGSIRTPHPCELFGDNWLESSLSGARKDETPGPAAINVAPSSAADSAAI